MNNLDAECEALIFTWIYWGNHLTNLPPNLKVICFSSKNADNIKEYNIKFELPIGCEIIFF